TYEARLFANDTITLLATSAAITVSTGSPSPPAAPSGLAATAASSTSINLTWVDNSTNETGFKIVRKTRTVNFPQIPTVCAPFTTYSASAMLSRTTYEARLCANDTITLLATSAAITVSTDSPSPPAAPSGLAATAASSTSINLTWVDNS